MCVGLFHSYHFTSSLLDGYSALNTSVVGSVLLFLVLFFHKSGSCPGNVNRKKRTWTLFTTYPLHEAGAWMVLSCLFFCSNEIVLFEVFKVFLRLQ